MRKTYSNDLKAKVALEAISEQFTVQEIAKKYEIHPNLVGLWKQQLIKNAASLFDKKHNDDQAREFREKEDLYLKEIGKLQIEKEFLKKKHIQLFGREPDL